LLELANDRAAAINSRDITNHTPLMVAATMASGKISIHTPAPITCCALLVGLGADRRAKNSDGETALSLVKNSIKSGEKLGATFGFQTSWDYSALLAILNP